MAATVSPVPRVLQCNVSPFHQELGVRVSPLPLRKKARLEGVAEGPKEMPCPPQGEALLCTEPRAALGPRPLTPARSSLSIEPSKSSIMPFRALKRPLQFLGLFETSLCRLTHIPAYKVGRRGAGGTRAPTMGGGGLAQG